MWSKCGVNVDQMWSECGLSVTLQCGVTVEYKHCALPNTKCIALQILSFVNKQTILSVA